MLNVFNLQFLELKIDGYCLTSAFHEISFQDIHEGERITDIFAAREIAAAGCPARRTSLLDGGLTSFISLQKCSKKKTGAAAHTLCPSRELQRFCNGRDPSAEPNPSRTSFDSPRRASITCPTAKKNARIRPCSSRNSRQPAVKLAALRVVCPRRTKAARPPRLRTPGDLFFLVLLTNPAL